MLLELYRVYILCSCTQEVQDVRSLLLLSRSVHKKFDPAYFTFFGKMYSPFCLHNCLFLFTAYFAKTSASKFCQGLPPTPTHYEGTGGRYITIGARRVHLSYLILPHSLLVHINSREWCRREERGVSRRQKRVRRRTTRPCPPHPHPRYVCVCVCVCITNTTTPTVIPPPPSLCCAVKPLLCRRRGIG